MTVRNMCHEAIHAGQYIFETIGEIDVLRTKEPFAYLVDQIVTYINSVKENKVIYGKKEDSKGD